MKCLVIGKCINENIKQFESACINIGRYLSSKNHTLQICSPYKDSADYWVMQGYSSIPENSKEAEIHFIDTPLLHQEVELLSENLDTQVRKIPHHIIGKEFGNGNDYSWLFCQLQALDNCDFIITIGGQKNGSAKMLLLIAESRGLPIIPFPYYKGMAEEIYQRNYYELEDRFGENFYLYTEQDKLLETEAIELFLNQPNSSNHAVITNIKEESKFFISYSRERPQEADFIENILRRRNFNVYRDDSDFGAGSNIPNTIKEHIYSSDVFISIWCKEYACSPWCYDELEIALDRSTKNQMQLWLFCVDDTRVVPKRARDIIYYEVDSREQLEGQIIKLMSKLEGY